MQSLIKFISVSFLLFTAMAVQGRESLPDFTTLVEKNHLAVVNISTLTHVSQSQVPNFPELDDPRLQNSPFGEYLRKFLEQQPDRRQPREFDTQGSGSGFIISADGYVMTNNHVVEGADEVTVRLTDRRQFIAKVVGTDKRSDIAVLKIEAKDLPFVTIGSADELKVGEWVLAIGSPFGFDFSVTSGIVSAKQRALPNERYIPFIQTDVAINPGNSGGPLFNLQGEVVGVNAQIFSRSGGFMGLSFAIPIDIAMEVADQLKVGGVVARGWLGVVIQEVTRDLAESFGMSKAYGALISRILPDSPAAKSPLKAGDIIVSFNGHTVDRSSSLPPIVGRSSLEKPAEVEIIRNGKRQSVKVALGELPTDEALLNANSEKEKKLSAKDNTLNIQVSSLDKKALEKFGADKTAVLVTQVDEGVAQQAGVVVGDLILSIDKQNIDSPEAFDKVVKTLKPGRSVPVLIEREQGPIFLAIKIP
jgi:serine protease Do